MPDRLLLVSCALWAALGLIATDASAQATAAARRNHPGVETAIALEGTGKFLMQGQRNRRIAAGDSFQVPTGTIHALRNDNGPMKIASPYGIQTGKPLVPPA